MIIKQRLLVATALVSGVALFFSANASAESLYQATENGTSTVSKNKTVDGTAYLAGNAVLVEGTVNGDVFCAGNSIRIIGTVNGDVICGGNNVSVDGTVNGDVRIAGASVKLDGVITGNATVAAGDVVLEKDLKLAGDVTGGAGTLLIDGTVGRDMTVAAGDITLSGAVKGDIVSSFDTALVLDSASVGGNFIYSSTAETTLPDGVVAGETSFEMIEQNEGSGQADLMWGIGAAVSIALLAFLGVLLMPRAARVTGDVKWIKLLVALSIGFGFVLFAPFVALVLLVTGFGAVVAYVLFLLWLLIMALSPVPIVYFVGTKVYGRSSNNVILRALVGSLILLIALLLPAINVLVFIAMLFIGTGLVLMQMPQLFSGDPYVVKNAVSTKKKKGTTAA